MMSLDVYLDDNLSGYSSPEISDEVQDEGARDNKPYLKGQMAYPKPQ